MKLLSKNDLDWSNEFNRKMLTMIYRDYSPIKKKVEFPLMARKQGVVKVRQVIKYFDLDYVLNDLKQRIKFVSKRHKDSIPTWNEYINILEDILEKKND